MIEMPMTKFTHGVARAVNQARREGVIMITSHNRPVAYVVDAETFHRFLKPAAAVAGLLPLDQNEIQRQLQPDPEHEFPTALAAAGS